MKYVITFVVAMGVCFQLKAQVCSSFFTSDPAKHFSEYAASYEGIHELEVFLELAKDPKMNPTLEGQAPFTEVDAQFLLKHKNFVDRVLKENDYSLGQLLLVDYAQINKDPRYIKDELIFLTIGETSYMHSLKPYKIDSALRTPGWSKIESRTHGFFRRPEKRFKLSEEVVLILSPEGEFSIEAVNLKSSKFLKEVVETQEGVAENLHRLVKNYSKELEEVYRKTQITNKDILNGLFFDAKIKGHEDVELILLNLNGVFLYFVEKPSILNVGNKAKWGLLNENSIGFLQGSSVEITAGMYLLKLYPGNKLEVFIRDVDAHLENLQKGASTPEMKEFFKNYDVEIKELLSERKINSSDFFSGNFYEVVSKKTGDHFFVLQKSEDKYIYFAEEASRFSVDGRRVGDLSQIDTKKQGHVFYMGPFDLILKRPAGFTAKVEVQTEINYERAEMIERMRAEQAKAKNSDQ